MRTFIKKLDILHGPSARWPIAVIYVCGVDLLLVFLVHPPTTRCPGIITVAAAARLFVQLLMPELDNYKFGHDSWWTV